jgi:preprotein translocase subunit SecG
MLIAITVVHILVCVGLILVVLLQTGKGAEVGAVFGGSSSTVFGSSGAGNFLTKLTTGMAVVFMITSLTLGYFASKRPSASIFDRQAPATPAPSQPVAPGAPAVVDPPAAPPPSAAPQGSAPEKTPAP